MGFHYSLILDFFSSRCCSAVGGGCCSDVNGCVSGFQRWILVATAVMVFFFSPSSRSGFSTVGGGLCLHLVVVGGG